MSYNNNIIIMCRVGIIVNTVVVILTHKKKNVFIRIMTKYYILIIIKISA